MLFSSVVALFYISSMAEAWANLTDFLRLWEEGGTVVLRDLKCPETSSWGITSEVPGGSMIGP